MIDRIIAACNSQVHKRMLDRLKDGPRTGAELQECLLDELAERGTVHVHVHRLRIFLQGHGFDLATVSREIGGKRQPCYQLMQVSLAGLAPHILNGKAKK